MSRDTAVDPALVERLRGRLVESGGAASPARLAALLRDGPGLRGDADLLGALPGLHSELAGAGPLQVLLDDPEVTDVLVNAPDEVWVDRGRGLEPAPVRFADDHAVRRLAVRLAAAAGRRLDAAAPFVDARLGDGSRLHAVLAPVSPRGTCLSLRVFRARQFDLPGLQRAGTLCPMAAALLRAAVGARLALLVSGGTGTGKTTLLGSLLGEVDPAERLVLVEDAGELRVDRPHVVRLETRTANVEGAGAVELRDLVRQALRMRPDRLVVGEVRGPEVVDLMTALNTGHEGGATTLHANAAQDVPARLEALAGLAGLGREALHSQLAAALQLVVHLRRAADGTRVVAEIAVLGRGADGLVTTRPAWARSAARRPTAAVGAASEASAASSRCRCDDPGSSTGLAPGSRPACHTGSGLDVLRRLLDERGVKLALPAGSRGDDADLRAPSGTGSPAAAGSA